MNGKNRRRGAGARRGVPVDEAAQRGLGAGDLVVAGGAEDGAGAERGAGFGQDTVIPAQVRACGTDPDGGLRAEFA